MGTLSDLFEYFRTGGLPKHHKVNVGQATAVILTKSDGIIKVRVLGHMSGLKIVSVREVFDELVKKATRRGIFMTPEMKEAVNINEIKHVTLREFKEYFVPIPHLIVL